MHQKNDFGLNFFPFKFDIFYHKARRFALISIVKHNMACMLYRYYNKQQKIDICVICVRFLFLNFEASWNVFLTFWSNTFFITKTK